MRTYIITRMYAGRYLEHNLGGEAINLLHDDHGNNYVFVGKLGFIDNKYNNSVEGVILTRLTQAGCFEVLGIAKIDKDGQVAFKQNLDDAKKELAKYIRNNDIRYGGVYLNDIFKDLYGADISFKSKELLLPKKPLYISDSHNSNLEVEDGKIFNLSDKRFSTTSLHLYVTQEDNPKSFDVISNLIDDDSLWEKGRINKIDDNRIIDKHFNFLDVIHKDFDELAYSNLFSYIFKTYPDTFREFVDKVLGVNISSSYNIYREKANIDLWIEDDNNIIVIENKIRSGINGIVSKNKEGIESQLKKYYEYALKERKNKNVHFFLFVPNYNKINLKEYLESKQYREIKYSQIYDFFSKVNIKDSYYLEFVNALYKHTKDRAIDYAEDMNIRLLEKIRKIKK